MTKKKLSKNICHSTDFRRWRWSLRADLISILKGDQDKLKWRDRCWNVQWWLLLLLLLPGWYSHFTDSMCSGFVDNRWQTSQGPLCTSDFFFGHWKSSLNAAVGTSHINANPWGQSLNHYCSHNGIVLVIECSTCERGRERGRQNEEDGKWRKSVDTFEFDLNEA